MLIPIGFFAASGGAAAGSYDLLATEILTSSQASVTFSSLDTLAAGYQHLQIRMVARATFSNVERTFICRVNSDSGNNYDHHGLFGTGSSVASYASTSQAKIDLGSFAANNAALGAFGAGVMDILDPFETSKYTTFRTLSGAQTTPHITLRSGLWMNTAALTSIEISEPTSNIAAGSRFSLYGLKASA